MNIIEIAKVMAALSGIAMILIGSGWIKRYIRSKMSCCFIR